ncbi:MAG: DinB family protein [Ginsengibacter sp.]
MQAQQELFTKIALDSWHIQIDRTNKLLENLTDEQLQQEVSTNRNSGVYLLGHLAAIHDAMLPLLNFGDKLYPDLENTFIKNPDKSSTIKLSTSLLRQYWKDVNSTLAQHFNKLKPEEWLQKHTAISEEDFAKEPHRNRLSVLLNRTNHLSYHFGQLAFLKK